MKYFTGLFTGIAIGIAIAGIAGAVYGFSLFPLAIVYLMALITSFIFFYYA